MENSPHSPCPEFQTPIRTLNYSAKRTPTLTDSHISYAKQKQQHLTKTKFPFTMGSTMTSGFSDRLSANSRAPANRIWQTRPSLNSKMNQKLEQIKKTCLKSKQPNQVEDEDSQESLCESLDLDAEKQPKRVKVYLRKSKYADRPRTIHFDYPKCCDIQNIHNPDEIIPLEGNPDLKYRLTGHEYKCIINALEHNGFNRSHSSKDWNVYFDIACRDLRIISQMNKFQKISHFPGCWLLGRKDYMWKLLQKMRRKFPSEYDFIPNTYVFPSDFERFQMIREGASKEHLWIMKPAGQACGRGIRMITKETKIRAKKDYVVSEYIKNPHLINGFKYDLRIYVVVVSYDPLRVYIFEEGLARFATYKYTTKLKQVKKRFIHLTNFSVNKHSKAWVKTQQDGQGSKWSLATLRKYYRSNGIDDQLLFSKVKDVIVKTCIAAESSMLDIHSKSQERRSCGFQLYGFDILVDEDLKPWLIQVNVCPSLSSSSPMDRKIKHTLLVDLLNLIGLEVFNRKKYEEEKKIEKEKNLTGLTGQGEKKALFSKNVNNLSKLTYQNCVQLLSPQDWLVLFELQEEQNRRGHFELLFPVKQTMQRYLQLFEFPRYNNLMIWKWLNSRNFLEHLS